MTPKPHVSAAIVQLRLWVFLAAAALVVAAAAHMLVFGFVHYTDVRWTMLESKGGPRVAAEVVRSAGGKAALAAADPGAPKAAEVNRVPSAVDRTMQRVTELTSTAGVIASVWLMALTCLGMVVAAGASVPGIERTVTSAAWSIVLALLCLPLKSILPSLPWHGVFGSYAELTTASEAVRAAGAGGMMLHVAYLLIPMVTVVGGVFVGLWFRTGVERGVLLTTVQQIDEALERELAQVRSRGVASNAPRAMSALTKTIGEAAGVPAETRMAAGAESMSLPAAESESGGRWRIGQPVPGSAEKRPI